MHVPSSEAVRAQPTVPGTLKHKLALLVVAASALGLAPQAAHAAPKILKKTAIVNPKTTAPVNGTLSGTKCYVKYPATTRKVSITVTGPLSAKKPKTHKLKVKGKKKVLCTWNTRAYADGKYRFTAKAQVKASGSWWGITIKRSVTVQNQIVTASTAASPQLGVGNTRYVGRLESQWDGFLNQGASVAGPFMRQHMWEVVVHPPFFDSDLSWAPPALAYKDLYAIYRNDPATLNAHPDWVLKDAAGNPTTIPWGCNPGPCPQFAGDIGNPAFRAQWIAQAKSLLAAGYHGIWIDDANMEMRIGDQSGNDDIPIDPRTGKPMTYLNWRRYIAEFLEQIRASLPANEIVANVLWFGGTSVGRDSDPYVQRAYTAVDRLNLERGFNDDGLTGGSSVRDIWSVDTFMKFIDRMHARGIPVTLDSESQNGVPGWEYNLAGYFLIDSGKDALGEQGSTPGAWWNGWDVKLGAPTSQRGRRPDGVYQRTFANGLVLLNPPRGSTITVQLPHAYKRIDGSVVTSVTLPTGRGAVLTTP